VRYRLFTVTFIGLALSTLLGALAMAAVLSLNLTRGFNDYLAARDREFVERAADILIAAARTHLAERQPNQPPPDLASLLRDPRLDLPPFRADQGKPPEMFPGQQAHLPPPELVITRLIVMDARGRRLAGPFLPPARLMPANIIRRDLVVDGEMLGTLLVLPRGPVPSGVDTNFLHSQHRRAALLVLLLGLFSLLPATLIARRGSGLVRNIRSATGAISRGDYDIRVAPSRIREIGSISDNINDMARSLSRLEATRRRMLAEISHELRTPLAAMRGEIDALVDGVRPLRPQAMVSLQEDVMQLGQLVDDLHLLALADLAALPCRFDTVEVLALCRAAMGRIAPQAERAGIDMVLNTPKLDELAARWDAARMRQLFGNLLGNSLAYTSAPGRVEMTLALRDQKIMILVDDSPPGVPVDQRAHLFEPLFRGDPARSRATGGSGLGLSISTAIVQAHGGTIDAAESPLGGLRIAITLPLDPEHRA
jgi:two-component system sensor histidine kinase BaeS